MRAKQFSPAFVGPFPDLVEEGVLYVSMEFRSALHRCACGCGRDVVTPLGTAQWRLIYDGRVSLHPSVGNWGLPCRSHYWIRENKVVWARKWSAAEIEVGRQYDRESLETHYGAPEGNAFSIPWWRKWRAPRNWKK